jgi:pimeloyl-ACP methyl ester carboxylesterase
LVLIHGLLGYSFSWRENMAALAARHSVYALDLPGLGYSQRARLDCSLPALANIVLRWMDALALRNSDVVGTSHGGALAMRMALLDRQAASGSARMRRLVLVAPVNPWSRAGRKRIAVLGSGVGGACARVVLPVLLPHLQRIGVTRMYGDPRRMPPGTIAGYGAPLRTRGTVPHLLRILRCWRADVAQLERDLPRLGESGLTVLLLWGSRDTAVPVTSAYELQQRLPGAQLVVLDGVGHLPYEEAPAEFNRAVLEFLA